MTAFLFRRMIPIAVLVFSFTLPMSLSAQPGEPPGMMMDGPMHSPEKFKAMRAAILREKIGLDEATASQVEAVMDKYGLERRRVRRQVRNSQEELEDLFFMDSDDQKAYRSKLEAIVKAEAQLQKLREKELNELGRFLEPKQQATLLMEMKKLHHKGKRGRMMGRRMGKGKMGPRMGGGPQGTNDATPF